MRCKSPWNKANTGMMPDTGREILAFYFLGHLPSVFAVKGTFLARSEERNDRFTG